MKDKFVTYHCENRIGFITMVRAEKRNALNPQLVKELKIAFETAYMLTISVASRRLPKSFF